MELKVRYHADIDPLEIIDQGDWIDLRAAEDTWMMPGDFKLISLGVSMQLPKGYEAHVVPRSSTFKNWGVLQTNHMGVIDESYCGDKDIWKFPAFATRPCLIEKNSRICQFRLVKKMDKDDLTLTTVEELTGEARGGFGSSGVK